MIREEAITQLHWIKAELIKGTDLNEPLDMAIEALQADTVSREEHFEVLANKITDMEERGFVQVVRCKDCKWWGGNKNTEHNNHICNRALNQNVDYWTRADDFCSYGERAEQKMEGNK